MKKESKKNKSQRIALILDALDKEYGIEPFCPLHYKNAFELLAATMLSAQCTDKRVNRVTRELFMRYPDMASLAGADIKELEKIIRPAGLYHNKAKNIRAAAIELSRRFGGEVPSDIESLTSLPGVGRKTANVIRGNIFHIPSIVVDTHVLRISRILGITEAKDPVRAEKELMTLLPEDHWILWNADLIRLGRTVCTARRQHCDKCFLSMLCPGVHHK